MESQKEVCSDKLLSKWNRTQMSQKSMQHFMDIQYTFVFYFKKGRQINILFYQMLMIYLFLDCAEKILAKYK